MGITCQAAKRRVQGMGRGSAGEANPASVFWEENIPRPVDRKDAEGHRADSKKLGEERSGLDCQSFSSSSTASSISSRSSSFSSSSVFIRTPETSCSSFQSRISSASST